LTKENKFPDIVFIGQPNCGKSTLFNAIAGLKAQTSNFPGTTVKHTHSKVNIEGKVLNIIDLPGTYSLNPSDPAEKVVLTHLFLEKPDLIFNVVDASILGRSLELTLELIELEYPVIVVLNMIDLAEKKGVEIDPKKLEKLLGVPVIPTVASHGRGVKELLDAAFRNLEKGLSVSHIKWSRDVEDKIEEMEDHLPEDFPIVGNKRFTAINMISSSKLLFDKMLKEINPALKMVLDRVRSELETRHNAPAYEVIAAERHHLAFKIFEESSRVIRGKRISMLDRVDDVIMHPFLGYLILLAVFLGFFFIIFNVGSPLEELLLGPLDNFRNFLSLKLGAGVVFYLVDGLLYSPPFSYVFLGGCGLPGKSRFPDGYFYAPDWTSRQVYFSFYYRFWLQCSGYCFNPDLGIPQGSNRHLSAHPIYSLFCPDNDHTSSGWLLPGSLLGSWFLPVQYPFIGCSWPVDHLIFQDSFSRIDT